MKIIVPLTGKEIQKNCPAKQNRNSKHGKKEDLQPCCNKKYNKGYHNQLCMAKKTWTTCLQDVIYSFQKNHEEQEKKDLQPYDMGPI